MIAGTFLLLLAASPAATDVAEPNPAAVDLLDAINCRLDAPIYTAFAMAIDGGEALGAKRGWHKVDGGSSLMAEYELPGPITVAGHYQTCRIGFTADSVFAILDLADPSTIAREEGISNQMDPNPMIEALVASGKASRDQVEKEIKFRVFMGERIVIDRTDLPTNEVSFGTRTVIAHRISNATTYPGKTFYGCSYQIEVIDKNGKPLR